MSKGQCIGCGSFYGAPHEKDCVRYKPPSEADILRQEIEALKADLKDSKQENTRRMQLAETDLERAEKAEAERDRLSYVMKYTEKLHKAGYSTLCFHGMTGEDGSTNSNLCGICTALNHKKG